MDPEVLKPHDHIAEEVLNNHKEDYDLYAVIVS